MSFEKNGVYWLILAEMAKADANQIYDFVVERAETGSEDSVVAGLKSGLKY